MSDVEDPLTQPNPNQDHDDEWAVPETGEGPEGTVSAGESGDAPSTPRAPPEEPAPRHAPTKQSVEVIIGEIPDTHDLAHMLQTARCSDPAHGLLGHFETKEEAEQARTEHLQVVHGG
jgi:hypothetical protein